MPRRSDAVQPQPGAGGGSGGGRLSGSRRHLAGWPGGVLPHPREPERAGVSRSNPTCRPIRSRAIASCSSRAGSGGGRRRRGMVGAHGGREAAGLPARPARGAAALPRGRSLFGRYATTIALYRLPDLPAALEASKPCWPSTRTIPTSRAQGPDAVRERTRRRGDAPYRKAVELKPDAPLLRIGLAQALTESNAPGANGDAIAHLEEAVAREPTNASAWRLLGIAQGRSGFEGISNLSLAEYALLIGKQDDARLYAPGGGQDRSQRSSVAAAPGRASGDRGKLSCAPELGSAPVHAGEWREAAIGLDWRGASQPRSEDDGWIGQVRGERLALGRDRLGVRRRRRAPTSRPICPSSRSRRSCAST